MSKRELSATQKRALAKLKALPGTASAYDLRESLATLESLARRGLVFTYTSGLGSLFHPRTGRQYGFLDKADAPTPE